MSKRSSLIHILFLVLSFFVLILLVLNFFKTANNSSTITISSFLNYISNSNIPRIEFNINTFQITGRWVVFDELRRFLNTIGSVIGAGVYLATSLFNIAMYCLYFVAFILA